jgi:hypothetical protein
MRRRICPLLRQTSYTDRLLGVAVLLYVMTEWFPLRHSPIGKGIACGVAAVLGILLYYQQRTSHDAHD